jgi:hypothetical protein
LRECSSCNERWEDERRLSVQFQAIRDAAAAPQPSIAAQQQLMREFDRTYQGGWRLWRKWAFGAAAVLLLLVAAVHGWRTRHLVERVQLTEGSDVAMEDFVDVPYAPPLAPGEFVRVVRTELEPDALAHMGIDVDGGDGKEVPADVLMGEDGFPRGVRILPEAELVTRQ